MSTATVTRPVQPPAPPLTVKTGPLTVAVPQAASPTEKRRRLLVEISDPGLDLQNDRILPNAIDTASGKTYPLLRFHDHSALPIGMIGQLHYGPNGRLRGVASLPPPGVSAGADEVVGLHEAGIELQFSIGGSADEAKPNREGGYDISKFSLREVSVVCVGAALGTGVLTSVKAALAAKSTGYGDAVGPEHARGSGDPTRDPAAVAACPKADLCPKRAGEACPLAEGCPSRLGGQGSGTGLGGGVGGGKRMRMSIWDKRAIPDADRQLGHRAGSERERNAWAMSHGKADVRARQRDEETRRGWDQVKSQLLTLDVRERPTLRPFIDIDRATMEQMPDDVKALVLGHLDADSDLNGA